MTNEKEKKIDVISLVITFGAFGIAPHHRLVFPVHIFPVKLTVHIFLEMILLLNSHVFKTTIHEFRDLFFHVLNVQTNKQTLVYMSKANTTKTSVCAPLVKLYKIVPRFALVLEKLKNKVLIQLASGHGSQINMSRE